MFSSEHDPDGSCERAYQMSQEKAENLQEKRDQRWKGIRDEQSREERRQGKHGDLAKRNQLKRDEGWKMTWISPEEWEIIKEMRRGE